MLAKSKSLYERMGTIVFFSCHEPALCSIQMLVSNNTTKHNDDGDDEEDEVNDDDDW